MATSGGHALPTPMNIVVQHLWGRKVDELGEGRVPGGYLRSLTWCDQHGPFPKVTLFP